MSATKVYTRTGKLKWRARFGKISLGFHNTKREAEAAVDHYKEFGLIDYEKQTREQDVPESVFEKELTAIPEDAPLPPPEPQPERKKSLFQRIFKR